MSRILLLLLVFVLQLQVVASPAGAPASSSTSCQMRTIRALMSDETVANMVRCQYEDVRSLLPGFATIDWTANERIPAGVIMRQSAGQGTPFSQLNDRFTLVVSAGPTVSVNSPSVIEGGTLTFQLKPPLRVSSPYRADYRLSLDPSGRRIARAGTDYSSVDDSNFLRQGRIDVSTRAGSGVERLYLLVMLTYPPDGPAANTVLGRGAGSIVAYPQVSLNDASAEEGMPLRFVASIDRSGVPDRAFSYRYGVGGDAQAGVDYVGSGSGVLTFAPGQDEIVLGFRTLENQASLDDHRLMLSVAGPGQKRMIATGLIANTTLPAEVTDPGEGEVLPDRDEVFPTESDDVGQSVTPDGGGAVVPNDGNDDNQENQPIEGFWPMVSNLGLEWLAVIGAIAIGLLGGLLIGVRKKSSSTPAIVDEPPVEPDPEPTVPPVAPVVGWTTTTPRPPRVKSGAVPIDGPTISIASAVEPGSSVQVESLSILPEDISDE